MVPDCGWITGHSFPVSLWVPNDHGSLSTDFQFLWCSEMVSLWEQIPRCSLPVPRRLGYSFGCGQIRSKYILDPNIFCSLLYLAHYWALSVDYVSNHLTGCSNLWWPELIFLDLKSTIRLPNIIPVFILSNNFISFYILITRIRNFIKTFTRILGKFKILMMIHP